MYLTLKDFISFVYTQYNIRTEVLYNFKMITKTKINLWCHFSKLEIYITIFIFRIYITNIINVKITIQRKLE